MPDPDDGKKKPPEPKTFTQEQLEHELGERLKREREKFADYDELRKKAGQLDQLQAEAKTAEQRAADAQAAADKRIADIEAKVADAEARALRAEVATAKGLNAAQAKRLQGATRDELEADADELLDAFPAPSNDSGGKQPPTTRPKPNLRGGTDPSEEPVETDPAKLAADVPRL